MKNIFIFFLMCLLFFESQAATYTVLNTNDAGAGSLRQAIIDANATASVADNISFNIPGAGPHSITILTPLPQLTSPVNVNGYTQSSSSQGTLSGRSIRIQINGGNVTNGNNGIFTFQAGASGSSLSGVAIYNSGAGVCAVSLIPNLSNIHIWGNYIGLLADGTLPPLGQEIKSDIIRIRFDAATAATLSNITIGTNGDGTNDANEGNIIGNSTNSTQGGEAFELGSGTNVGVNATNIKISGNYIGLRPDGSSAAPIGFSGSPSGGTEGGTGITIYKMTGSNFVIGSNGDGVSDALERNVVANCRQYGIYLDNSSNINIAGNYVGTDATGTVSKPNGTDSPSWVGVIISKSSASTFVDNIVIGFDDSKHAAAVAPNVRNIISGNNGRGILLNTNGSASGTGRLQNVVIAGNYIGVDVTGNVALPNGQFGPAAGFNLGAGIGIGNSINNRIGTDSDGDDDDLERNVVSGNINGAGIYLSSGTFASDGNVIAGNYIGVGANGTTALGNGHAGVYLSYTNGINNNRIGSNDDGVRDATEANIIANNGGNASATIKSGIGFVKQAAATGTAINNRFSRNIYYNNAALPIDLMNDATTTGVTANDGATTTGAPNLLLDYPVITSYALSGTTMTVSGYVSNCNGNEMTAGTSIAGAKRIQFYKVSDDGNQNGPITASCNARSANHGEGILYLGAITGITNSFNTTFTLESGATFAAGDKITAIAIDANGSTSEFGVLAQVTITGTVYNDVNGATNIDGTTINTATGAPTLYASLYEGSTLIATVPVSATDGTYSFTDGAVVGVTYNVVLGTNATANPTSPFTGAGSGGWVIIGEDCCDNTGNDGNANGQLTVIPTFAGAVNANFGINQPPTAVPGTITSTPNPGGTTSIPVTTSFGGTDPNGGIITSLTITSFPTNATSITIGGITYTPTGTGGTTAWPGTVTVPTNASGIPTTGHEISVDPVDGAVTVGIPFTVTDNAGLASPGATLNVPFSAPTYTISGTVYNDGDGQTGGADGNLFNGSSTPLYVNLYDSGGNFIASSAVDANGKYTFPGISPGTGYQIQVSSVQATGGTISPNAPLPGTYGNISSNGETGLHTDGVISFDVIAGNVSGLDFGIQRPPVADVINNPAGSSSDYSPTQPGFPPVTGYLSIPYINLDPMSGTDPEDPSVPIAGNTIKIGTVNPNTKVYYDFPVGGPREVAPGEEIPSFDPAKLVFYGQLGSGTTSDPFGFTYSVRDEAGVFSAPADYNFSTSDTLPVTLSSFSAKKGEHNSVTISWTTTEESNSDKFEVEHSINGKNWTWIGSVTAKGESKDIARYSLVHDVPVKGQNLYRLKMVDADATFAYSKIVGVNVEVTANATIYPNPAVDKIYIKLDGTNAADVVKVNVFAQNGKVMYTADKMVLGGIDTTSLTSGTYIVAVTLKNGTTQNTKIVIVK